MMVSQRTHASCCRKLQYELIQMLAIQTFTHDPQEYTTTDWEWNYSTHNRTNAHVEDTGQMRSGSHLQQNKGARRRQMQYWTKHLWIVISNWIIGSKSKGYVSKLIRCDKSANMFTL